MGSLQERSFEALVALLPRLASRADLLLVTGEVLRLAEEDGAARLLLVPDLMAPGHVFAASPPTAEEREQSLERLREAHAQSLPTLCPYPAASGPGSKGDPRAFIVPFSTDDADAGLPGRSPVQGGLHIELHGEAPATQEILAAAVRLARSFAEASHALRAGEHAALQERIDEQARYERLRTIADRVASLAHEAATPLGVSLTANEMVVRWTRRLSELAPGTPEFVELKQDLDACCEQLERNLRRTYDLIRAFKDVTAREIADRREVADLGKLIEDFILAMSPESRRRKIPIRLHAEPAESYLWDSYPGPFIQVLLNLMQNVLRYAYPGEESGAVDIHLRSETSDDQRHYCIDFVDHGHGVAPEILPRLFEPYVSSGQGTGGTGLGLAIVYRIVTHQLRGSITCESRPGQGTRFRLRLPFRLPDVSPG
jgi:signal transduction histidine kinase